MTSYTGLQHVTQAFKEMRMSILPSTSSHISEKGEAKMRREWIEISGSVDLPETIVYIEATCCVQRSFSASGAL
jgi:hypothetical protein